jgi:hypothetical protein
MNKPTLSRCFKLLDDDLSIITVGENKIPNFTWKRYQTKKYTKSDFEKAYDYSGGKTFVDKTTGELIEIKPSVGVGIATGYNNIEVIDVDLKVLQTLKDQQDFWKEYTTYLRESIDDFDTKFVIYKTVNNGYHIIYKCAKLSGNIKIACLQGIKQAIIESRGIGGYVWIYDNQVSKKGYDNIQEISEKDRDLLWEISRSFHYVEAQPEQPKEIVKQYKKAEGSITPWEDFNIQNRVWDLICNEFTIIKKLSDKTVIRRHGATSASSGTIYNKDNKMYLFSTGTIYPHEKPLSPFDIYAIKNYSGDFRAAAKDLYQKNYGSRIVNESPIKELPKLSEKTTEKKVDKIEFPIDIFPEDIQTYMKMCNSTLSSNIDYMGCSFLWLLSLIIGNSVKVKVKGGWIESAIIWISLVGEAGIGKTPSISRIIYPLKKINNQEIKKYIKNSALYEAWNALDKKEKQVNVEVKKPSKAQIIVSDFTIEAITDLHEESKNAIGVFCDELAGWYKDMNKYRAGSDLEFWLSSWSNEGIAVNRKTAKSSFVESPILPVLGGIQPKILVEFFTEQNKDNGFIDRMLTSYPDLKVDEYNDNELSEDVIEWYNDYVVNFYNKIKHEVIKLDTDCEIKSKIAFQSDESKKQWIRIFNEITAHQNSDDENEYMKSMYPKQKSYIPRFALMLNTLYWYDNPEQNQLGVISEKSMLNAEKLSKYFVFMAKKHKLSTIEYNDVKKIVNQNENKSTKDKIFEILSKDPTTEVKFMASILGVSKKTVYQYLKEINK